MSNCENNKVMECSVQTDVSWSAVPPPVAVALCARCTWAAPSPPVTIWMGQRTHTYTHRCTWTLSHTHTHLMHRHRGRERLRERTCALNRPPEVPEHEEIRMRRERGGDFSVFNKLHENIFIRHWGSVSVFSQEWGQVFLKWPRPTCSRTVLCQVFLLKTHLYSATIISGACFSNNYCYFQAHTESAGLALKAKTQQISAELELLSFTKFYISFPFCVC